MINPSVIGNQESRNIKIQMLISKPFALSDGSIKKLNQKITSKAFDLNQFGGNKAKLPK